MAFTKIKTMKKLLVILLLFTSTIAFGQEKAKWYIDFEKAAQVSMQTGKPILADFTGSDWCGWCIRLQKEVFFKPDFVKWAKENLVLVELDFPRRKKLEESLKQQNENLRQMFAVRGYPTGWFVVPEIEENKVNFKRLGSQGYVAGGPKNWIDGANKILSKK